MHALAMNMLICWRMYQSNPTEEFCHEVLIDVMAIDPQRMVPRSLNFKSLFFVQSEPCLVVGHDGEF